MKKSTPKKPASSSSIQLGAIFGRFHMIIFFLLLVGGLVYAILSLGDILTAAENGSNATAPPSTGLTSSQSTVDAINKLHASNQPASSNLPTGRLNPFGE